MSHSSQLKQTSRPTLADALCQEAHQPTLITLIENIADCTIGIAALIAKGAITHATDKLSKQNVQGETQMQLDVTSNDLLIQALKKTQDVHYLVSEELENALFINEQTAEDAWIVCADPLDGSSNVAVNGTVGTIFSILKSNKQVPLNLLQTGHQQVAAGYALYGPSTMLVLTMGAGTHGFTLDEVSQVYLLTHPNMKIPESTAEYAINASNARFWEPPMQQYIAECNAGIDGLRGKDFNMRWVASMVADVHRILMRGGVYLYPKDNKKPAKAGRLRLLYEANPMSFIVEQAGGKSTDGRQDVLDIMPDHIHQRVPVVMGSADEVKLITQYHHLFDQQ